MRACTKCGEAKPLEAFPPVRRGEPRLQTWCRACFAVANARNYRRDHERQKARLIGNVCRRRAENRRLLVKYLAAHPCIDCGEADIVVLEFDHRGGKIADLSTYSNSGRRWERIKAEMDKCDVRCANCHRRKTLGTRRSLDAQGPAVASRRTERPIQLLIDAAFPPRRCRICAEEKPLSGFPFRSLRRQTRQWICLACQREYTNGWYARNRETHAINVRTRERAERAKAIALARAYLEAHPCVDCGEVDSRVLEFDHLRDKRAEISRLVRTGRPWGVIQREIDKCEVRCANCHRRRTARQFGYYRLRAVAVLMNLRPRGDSNARLSAP